MAERKKRATRDEMIAATEAKLAKLLAQKSGEYVDDSIVKRLKNRLSKVNRTLRAANLTVNGVAGSEGKGWSRSPIAEKIATTEARLESQRESQRRATEEMARLPFDVKSLEALVASAEQGDEVEFPTDLYPIGNEQDRTDEQHEAHAIASDEASEES